MLHATQGALAGITHTQRSLHSRLLIRAPFTMDASLPSDGRALDVFRDLSRRGSRIGVHARQAGINRRLGDRLVPQK